MWLMTVLGFFSIACARKPDGDIDPDLIMIRARRAGHLRALKNRFPDLLVNAKLMTLDDTDYRYRFIVPKEIWVRVLCELATEQRWSNFKNEVAVRQGRRGRDYIRALHDVWVIMYRLHNGAS